MLLRLLALHVDRVVLLVALASALHPRPEGMDLVTVLVLALILTAPTSKRVLHFVLLAWMQAMALTKLTYQLREVSVSVRNEDIGE